MKQLLQYFLYPNPPSASYTSTKVLILTVVCLLLIIGSFVIKNWRRKQKNPMTKKLSKSWSSASFWFGFIGVFMIVSRVEGISYVSMPLWWIVWIVSLVGYIFFQWKLYTAKHYEVIPQQRRNDPREKYLPGKK